MFISILSTCFEQPCAHHQESLVSIRHGCSKHVEGIEINIQETEMCVVKSVICKEYTEMRRHQTYGSPFVSDVFVLCNPVCYHFLDHVE